MRGSFPWLSSSRLRRADMERSGVPRVHGRAASQSDPKTCFKVTRLLACGGVSERRTRVMDFWVLGSRSLKIFGIALGDISFMSLHRPASHGKNFSPIAGVPLVSVLMASTFIIFGLFLSGTGSPKCALTTCSN